MRANIKYMLKNWIAWDKKSPVYFLIRVPALVFQPIVTAYIPKAMIDCIEKGVTTRQLILVVALLSLLLVAFANVGTQGTGSYVNCMIVKSGMPKVSYKVLVLIAMVYVSALTVWGGVEEHFGAFISIAAFIQAPIIGMIVVDYLVVKKRKLSLKAAYFIEGHDAYRFTGGFNLVGIGCVILSCLITILFVYNPLTGSIQSPLFLIFTGSGFDAICGGLLYWLASLTPLKKYMLRDRDDLEIV